MTCVIITKSVIRSGLSRSVRVCVCVCVSCLLSPLQEKQDATPNSPLTEGGEREFLDNGAHYRRPSVRPTGRTRHLRARRDTTDAPLLARGVALIKSDDSSCPPVPNRGLQIAVFLGHQPSSSPPPPPPPSDQS